MLLWYRRVSASCGDSRYTARISRPSFLAIVRTAEGSPELASAKTFFAWPTWEDLL